MNTDMPEFNSAATCAKCGEPVAGGPMRYRYDSEGSEFKEWMMRFCPVCGYEWNEKLPVLEPASV